MNWQARLVTVGAAVLVVLGLVLALRAQHKTLVTEHDSNTVLRVANQALAQDAQLTSKSMTVTDDVVASAVSETEEIKAREDSIARSAQMQISAITQHYNALPVTTDPRVTQDRESGRDLEISRIRITSLWQTYCSGVPDNARCASVPRAP